MISVFTHSSAEVAASMENPCRKICPDCRKQAQIEKERNSQVSRWQRHVLDAAAKLNLDAAEAHRLCISDGNDMAAIHDGRIKRMQEV